MSHLKNIWISAAVILLCLCATSVRGDWSSPPEIVYPPSAPNSATLPFIATDGIGNSVAVWFDTTGSGSMQAAILAAGSVNGMGQPDWVLTSPIATSNVQAADNPYAQAVGVDSSGNATAVWTDGTHVFMATLPFGQTTWSSPLAINTPISLEVIADIYIAVAANGNAVVTWTSSVNGYEGTIFANVFDSGLATWAGQVNILGATHVQFNLSVNPVAVDSIGDAVVALTATSSGLQAASYNATSKTWTQIPSIAPVTVLNNAVAMGSNGTATIVWIQGDDTTHAATLVFNASSLTNLTSLSSTADIIASSARLVTDASGNAVAVWADISGKLGSARYSFDTQVWTILPLLNPGGTGLKDISLAGNAAGNIMASWSIFEDPTSYIQVANLIIGDYAWGPATQISPSSDFDNHSQITLTPTGIAVAMWEDDSDGSVGTIDSAISLDPFLPVPSSSFKGEVVLNKFFLRTDRVHQLTWKASPDPSVVQYYLYRNSVLIATVEAIGSGFTYQDHNRSKNVSDTYRLIALNANGDHSTSLSVTLQ